MRLRILPLLLVSATACTPAASDLSQEVRERAVAEVRAATDSLTAAMNAHDVERFHAFFDLGPDFVYGSCTEFLTGGETFAGLTQAYHMAKKDVVFDIQIVSVRILAPSVAVVGLQTVSSDSTASHPVITTEALSKGRDGRWRVVHQHQSWPDCSRPKAPHPMTTGTLNEGFGAEADTLG